MYWKISNQRIILLSDSGWEYGAVIIFIEIKYSDLEILAKKLKEILDRGGGRNLITDTMKSVFKGGNLVIAFL